MSSSSLAVIAAADIIAERVARETGCDPII